MADIDPKALFATMQKLLQQQARMAELRAERDRWTYDARTRERAHQQLLDQLKREFGDTLHELRKQLGLPDVAATVQETIKSMADTDVGRMFTDLFGDFFKADRGESASSS